MKKLVLLVILSVQSLLWSAEATAAPCATGSLASYVALGAAGCTIDGTLFSNFGLLSRPNGTVPFASITVTPVFTGPTIVGVDFGVAPSVSGGSSFDDLIAYRVTGIGTGLTGASLFLNGYATTGNASVTGIENLCLGGTFLGVGGVDGCSSGPAGTVTLVVADATPDATTFAARAFASVVTDIGVDSGPGGADSGSLTSASNRFTVVAAPPNAVPEPGAALLLAAGLGALVAVRRRHANDGNGRG